VTDPERLVRVGRIVKPHGVEGTLTVEVHTDFPAEQFAPGRRLRVEGTGKLPGLTVTRVRPHQGRLLLDVEEVADRDRAEELRDRWLMASPVESGEGRTGYREDELVGLRVEDENGRELGTIEAVRHPDAHPVFEIRSDALGTLDFPAHEDLVEAVSLEEGRLRVRLPRGWKKLIRDRDQTP